MRVRAESDERLTPEDEAALRYALLSVYYASVGKQLELRGAPAVLLPPAVRLLTLGEALAEIADRWPDYRRDATWRVVRAVAPPSAPDKDETHRYPVALAEALGDERPLGPLDELRWRYREGANVFAAALIARVRKRTDEFEGLRKLLRTLSEANPDLAGGMESVLGLPALEFLDQLDDEMTALRLSRLAAEVGVDLYDYAGEIADAAAFLDWWPPAKPEGMTVYPAAAVVRQDSRTLTTTVTVTALVRSKFETLRRAADPQCWGCSSDVVTGTRYVRDAFDLTPPETATPAGKGWDDGPRLLEEDVNVSWGFDANSVGAFHNVLRVSRFAVKEEATTIDVDFRLSRSIDSRILWDRRPGGILIDEGFIKVRPIAGDRWRLTTRKVLKFSDRTPDVHGPGWFDFGEMLNYLAPAALSWWLESELYSAADSIYSDAERIEDCLRRYSERGE